jgi:hypothetical protein
MEKQQTNDDFWADFKVIGTYTAADMMRDGMLTDVSYLAKEMEIPFKVPIRMTHSVIEVCQIDAKAPSFTGLTDEMKDILFGLRVGMIFTALVEAIRKAPKEETLWILKGLKMDLSEGLNEDLWAEVDTTSGPAIHIMVPSER